MGVIADILELEASAVGIILAGESGDESARLASRKAARALPGVADFDQVPQRRPASLAFKSILD